MATRPFLRWPHPCLTTPATPVGAITDDIRAIWADMVDSMDKDLRLVGGYDLLYGQVKAFIRERLFEGSPVDIDSPVVLRNLSNSAAAERILTTFKSAINALTVQDAGTSRIEDYIRLRDVRPFRTQHREWLPVQRSVFNRIVGEAGAGGLELRFARFLDQAEGVVSFAKNYLAVGFKLDYVKGDGDLSTYTPDFMAKGTDGTVWIIETKGREELDLPRKMARLAQWCSDASAASAASASSGGVGGPAYRFVFVDQERFDRHPPASLAELVTMFREYQPAAA